MEGIVLNLKCIFLWDKLIILKFFLFILNILFLYELMYSLISDVIENIVVKFFLLYDIFDIMFIFVI